MELEASYDLKKRIYPVSGDDLPKLKEKFLRNVEIYSDKKDSLLEKKYK